MKTKAKRKAAMQISTGIKALRTKLGLTHGEMALRAGVSESSLRRYENRETMARGPQFIRILRLCPDAESLQAFGINVTRFMPDPQKEVA